MKVINFKTTLKNGIVTIPAEYSSEWEGKQSRVILLDNAEDSEQTVEQLKAPDFRAISLKTKEFKFNREEANDR